MFLLKFINFARQALLAVLFAGSAGVAGAAGSYHVEIDTSSLSGTGYLDFSFLAAVAEAPSATATLSNFSGALGALVSQDGAVSGSLATTAVFGNTAFYNDLFHSVALGGKFGFDIVFGGAYLGTLSGDGSTFGVALYDASNAAYPGYEGNLVQFDLSPLSASGAASIATRAGGMASIAAVPEPAEWLLLMAGLLVLAVAARRRAAGQAIYLQKI